MKISRYQFCEEIAQGYYLHYNALSNTFLLLDERCHDLYSQCEIEKLETLNKELFSKLTLGKFLIADNFDEYQYVLVQKEKMVEGTDLYNVVVNTSLDCNLNCWYCYENKIVGSRLEQRVVDAIKRNIFLHYINTPFSTLKLGFFGGEPFLCFDGIKQLLDYAREFCAEKDIELIADFTTNATLITAEHINYLKQYRCHFQITLDGGRQSHNKIKVDKLSGMNTYDKTLETLRLINDNIEQRWVAVRINFDNRTLRDIDEIIQDLDFLDRRKTYVIIKKVWQLKTENIDKDALMSAIQKFLDKKFLVDYYIMPKGCVCFAERRNQVLFNYDGKIFKCTTISEFTDKNVLGSLDYSTGEIAWDKEKIEAWFAEMQPDYCKTCKWFPSCLGICNRQLLAHKGEKICTFDACNLTEKEYLMYLFKYNILKNELDK